MANIKLYGYATSPYVRKTGCFLYYKGVDFAANSVKAVRAKHDDFVHYVGFEEVTEAETA